MTSVSTFQDLEELPRKRLQSYAKRYHVKANLPTSELIGEVWDAMCGKENSNQNRSSKRNKKRQESKKQQRERPERDEELSSSDEDERQSEQELDNDDMRSSDDEPDLRRSRRTRKSTVLKAAPKKSSKEKSRAQRRSSMRVRVPPPMQKEAIIPPLDLYREICQLPQKQLYHVFGALLGQRKENLFKNLPLHDKTLSVVKFFVIDDHSLDIEDQLVFDISIAMGIGGNNCLFTLRGNAYEPHDFTVQINDTKYDCGFEIPLHTEVQLAGETLVDTYDPLEDGDEAEDVGNPSEPLHQSLLRLRGELIDALRNLTAFRNAAKDAKIPIDRLAADVSDMVFRVVEEESDVDEWELPFFRFPEGTASAMTQSLIAEMFEYSKEDAKALDALFVADAKEIITEQLEAQLHGVCDARLLDSFRYIDHSFAGTSASPSGRTEFVYDLQFELLNSRVSVTYNGRGMHDGKMRVSLLIKRGETTLLEFKEKKHQGLIHLATVVKNNPDALKEWGLNEGMKGSAFLSDLTEMITTMMESTTRDVMLVLDSE